MYKISCPNCDHEFTADFDSEGICECPNCSISLSLGEDIMGGYDFAVDFEECVTESMILWEEVKNLDDSSLEDEIAYQVTNQDFMKGTFAIFAEMESVGYMAWDTRKKAEGVYLLTHTTKYFGYEQ